MTETIARSVWTADAWYLEHRYPEEFGTGRREPAELRKIVNRLAAERIEAAPVDGIPADARSVVSDDGGEWRVLGMAAWVQ